MKLAIIFVTLMTQVFAVETCSRVAVIDGQEVLIDTSTAEKGEGLRFYLEKDPIAKSYLDKYQRGTEMKWQSAFVGTLGTVLILAGILTSSDSKKRTSYIIGGSSLMAVNFFLTKTMANTNERNLERSIEEYNRRNSPPIFIKDDIDEERTYSFTLTKTWSF